MENGGKIVEEFQGAPFFSGAVDAKLDSKNRLVLPYFMRYGLVEEGRLECTLGLSLGGCLAIYRRSDILKIAKKFQENLFIAKYQKFFTLFFSTLHHTTCDKIGRISIPSRLKQSVHIEKEIVIAGVLNKIEIWPKEAYDRQLNNLLEGKDPELDLAKMTEEAFALLREEKQITPHA